jgi:hypothetical protein
MTTKNIRFLLKEIEVYYDGDEYANARNKKTAKERTKDNLVEASLEYPRSGAPVVTSIKTMDLQSKVKKSVVTSDFWASGFFKEDVDSETRFRLSVSDKDEVSGFNRWFRRIFSLMFSTATGGGVKGISNLFQGAVASDLQSKLVDGIKGSQPDSTIKLLCSSEAIHIEVKESGITAYTLKGATKTQLLNEKNEFVVELKAAKDFVKKKRAKRVGPKAEKTREEILMFEKGQKLGEATILIVSS